MNSQIATQQKWAQIVMSVADAGHAGLANALAHGAVQEFTGKDGITYRTPPGGLKLTRALDEGPLQAAAIMAATRAAPSTPAPASPPGVPRFRGKAWHELAPIEQHDLFHEDHALYERMKNAPLTWKGKTWDELDDGEKTELYGEDTAQFLRMMEDAQ